MTDDDDNDDNVELQSHVIGCRLTYQGQIVTSVEARFNCFTSTETLGRPKAQDCEPVWPSGNKAPRLVSGTTSVRCRLSSLFKTEVVVCQWALSCDFVHHFLLKH